MAREADGFIRPEECDDVEDGRQFAPKFDGAGLIPCITIEAATNQPLMFAFMNSEALARTIETGEAWYWSRSRRALWKKGESSGNTQRVVEMRTDCDQDVIVIRVAVDGHGATCHTGRHSCFYRKVTLGVRASKATLAEIDDERLFDPQVVYDR